MPRLALDERRRLSVALMLPTARTATDLSLSLPNRIYAHGGVQRVHRYVVAKRMDKGTDEADSIEQAQVAKDAGAEEKSVRREHSDPSITVSTTPPLPRPREKRRLSGEGLLVV